MLASRTIKTFVFHFVLVIHLFMLWFANEHVMFHTTDASQGSQRLCGEQNG